MNMSENENDSMNESEVQALEEKISKLEEKLRNLSLEVKPKENAKN